MFNFNKKNDAIDYLDQQHDEVDALFEKADEAKNATQRARLFEQIADALAVHCELEEKLFYPAVYKRDTKDLLLEAVEEHLGVKRIIADLLELEPKDDHYKAKLTVMREQVKHHVREERDELFPKVKKILDADAREQLGVEMRVHAEKLAAKGDPRKAVRKQVRKAAELATAR